ncbi:lipid phosphotransferase [Ligilactobacillus ceti DSM 22408]|uniref:Cardiolipin synthase n=1 Tax=Ligilactobacillus ceti DSM 22408 TaxID=1122146 RepID=A0A0R2KHM7_9LACO|nr:lipid phosphotransferase [Ligilactobacillus ceti DSM 22408]
MSLPMKHEEKHLINKGHYGFKRAIFSRFGLIFVLLIIQFVILFGLFAYFINLLPHFLGATFILDAIMVIYLFNNRMDPTAKITWLLIILSLPIFGSLLLLYVENDFGHRKIKQQVDKLINLSKNDLKQNPQTYQALAADNLAEANLATYLERVGNYPVYRNSEVTYFPLGEDKFQAMMEELEKAEKFIFLEYFIIKEGYMWGNILDVLIKKAQQGVTVRVMYDGMNELSALPHDYPEKLAAVGIECKIFSPLVPFISTHYNYRDHRKILVIDGQVGFTGGVNLADEYINKEHRFGHWKDTAVRVKGPAVKNFTLMFLRMWNIIHEHDQDFAQYLAIEPKRYPEAAGYVLPYADEPLDENKVGEMVYLDILNRAKHYVHIMTPYLILDEELITALKFAAQRGVEVKIILPGIPDKKVAYSLAKSHYAELLDAGVQIYQYTPGFVHAKVFVSDDVRAVVGTINLDYRSLYHHFECATYMYKTANISQIAADFNDTMAKCERVTYQTIKDEKLSLKISGKLAKLIAPLL